MREESDDFTTGLEDLDFSAASVSVAAAPIAVAFVAVTAVSSWRMVILAEEVVLVLFVAIVVEVLFWRMFMDDEERIPNLLFSRVIVCVNGNNPYYEYGTID